MKALQQIPVYLIQAKTMMKLLIGRRKDKPEVILNPANFTKPGKVSEKRALSAFKELLDAGFLIDTGRMQGEFKVLHIFEELIISDEERQKKLAE